MMKPFSLEQLASKILPNSPKGSFVDDQWTEFLHELGHEVWDFLTGPRGAGAHTS